MVEKDYMMRLIHEMVRTIAMLIFHKDQGTEEESLGIFTIGCAMWRMKEKLMKRRICCMKAWKKMTGTGKGIWKNWNWRWRFMITSMPRRMIFWRPITIPGKKSRTGFRV